MNAEKLTKVNGFSAFMTLPHDYEVSTIGEITINLFYETLNHSVYILAVHFHSK